MADNSLSERRAVSGPILFPASRRQLRRTESSAILPASAQLHRATTVAGKVVAVFPGAVAHPRVSVSFVARRGTSSHAPISNRTVRASAARNSSGTAVTFTNGFGGPAGGVFSLPLFGTSATGCRSGTFPAVPTCSEVSYPATAGISRSADRAPAPVVGTLRSLIPASTPPGGEV